MPLCMGQFVSMSTFLREYWASGSLPIGPHAAEHRPAPPKQPTNK